jgi:chromate reductase, NAD(P)H dehydrogenase (quinone)
MKESAMTSHSILLLPGSLRAGSFTTTLLRAAADLLPADFDGEVVDLIRPLPYYDGDLDQDPLPQSVIEMRARVAAADGLIVSTPEYNGSVPGGLKNWVDWATRPFQAHAMLNKPVVVLGASPSPKGAHNAVTWLTEIFGYLGARVVGESVKVASVSQFIAEDGKLDPAVIDQLRPLVDSLVEAVRHPVS